MNPLVDEGMIDKIVEMPILETITTRDVNIIISGSDKNKEKHLEEIIDKIYTISALPRVSAAEKKALHFFIQDVCMRYLNVERDTHIPYINHAATVSKINAALGEDFTTIVSALYHDVVEEYIAGIIKKETQMRIIEENDRRAVQKYRKKCAELRKKETKSIKLTKYEKEVIKNGVEEDYKLLEGKLIPEYLSKLRITLTKGLLEAGIYDEAEVNNLVGDVCETVGILTRSYYDTYYDAVDKIISPNPNIRNIENKFRAIKIKFADSIANTEIIKDKDERGYKLKDLAQLWTEDKKELTNTEKSRLDNELKKLKSITKELGKKHKEEKKIEKRVPGKKRLYRNFKSYLFINAYGVYFHHMYISKILKEMADKDMFSDLFEKEGFFKGILQLTKDYISLRTMPKTEKMILVSKLEKYERDKGITLPYLISKNLKRRFIRRCCESGYFNYLPNSDLVRHIYEMYLTEGDIFEKEKEQIKKYEMALVQRTYNSAKTIIDHLVAYHSAGPHLSHENIHNFIKQNKVYIKKGGYKFVTNPILKEEFLEQMDKTDLEKLNGETRKTLKAPDGILLMFIDARIRGENKRLDDLYLNKANMFLTALASKTIGYSFKHYPNYIIVGMDSRGIHPTKAIASKTYEALKKEESKEQKTK